MALTVTNVNSLHLLNILNRTSTDQDQTMKRLSTGLKINRGQDDPAGLLALKGIESELTSVNAAIANNQRTDSMLSVADSALNEVASLLSDIQALAQASSNSAGLTAAEISANQSQIDSAISSIDRIIRTTEFNGRKLLDGSQAINATNIGASISDIHVYSRDPNQAGSTGQTVNVTLTTSAAYAAASGSTRLVANSASVATTIEIKGSLGTQIIEVAKDENLSAVVAKINDVKSLTGVSASHANGNVNSAVNLYSTGYGSDQFVKVTVLEGGTTYGSGSDYQNIDTEGRDAVVSVNGMQAAADGNEIFVNQNGLSMSFTIDTSMATNTTESFTIDESGGATFQLGTDSTTRATLGIDGMFSHRLGNSTKGYLASLRSGGAAALLSDPAKAADIADVARKQVATLQGRIGGFQKYQVQTSLNSMNVAKESLTAVKSIIADVDYAVETANLTKQNVLMQSAMSLLGMANQQSAQVLSLLM